MLSKKRKPERDEAVARTAREEIMLLLFRDFTPLQQQEEIKYLRAMFDANRVTLTHLGGRLLKNVSNEKVAAAFKQAPPSIGVKPSKPRRPPGRPDDAPMDDFPDPGGNKN